MSEDDPISLPAEDAETRAAALQHRLVELEAQSRERLIRAELKAEALRAGMVDLDGLKLVDAGVLSVDETGEVQGAVTLMQSLRRAKPWLFNGPSTSSAARPPPAQSPRPRRATEMTAEEWLAARAELLRRR
jgi:hypothetical protein